MIRNKTTGELINIKIKYADNFYRRFLGLMGKRDIEFALIFSNLVDSSIHTFFMRFELDIYFLDENKIIFDKVCLKPWSFYRPKMKAKYIIESKKNRLNLKIGDKLDFI